MCLLYSYYLHDAAANKLISKSWVHLLFKEKACYLKFLNTFGYMVLSRVLVLEFQREKSTSFLKITLVSLVATTSRRESETKNHYSNNWLINDSLCRKEAGGFKRGWRGGGPAVWWCHHRASFLRRTDSLVLFVKVYIL